MAHDRERHQGKNPDFVNKLAILGTCRVELKKYAEAEPVLRECLALRQKAIPEHWTTFNATSLLGAALLGQKKYAEAEPLLVSGYEGMKAREKQIPPQGKLRLQEAGNRLLELYTAWNKPDKLTQWRERFAREKP